MKIFQHLFLIALSFIFAPTFCQAQDSDDSGFSLLDTDSDGKLTKKELKDYTEKIMPGFPYGDKFADRVDADSDGLISEEELKKSKSVLTALSREINGGAKPKKDKPKKLTEKDLANIDEANKAYDALAKLVSQDDWEKAAKGMTKEASDAYAVGMVTQSLSLTKMKLPPQMEGPTMDEAKAATKDVINDYDLGDIDISFFMKRPSGKAEQEKAKAEKTKLEKQILKALDAEDQRWKIISALRKAQKGTAFNRDVLAGKVSGSTVDDSTVFLIVIQEKPEGQMAIPIVAKMTSEDGQWKYAGIDGLRTRKAMQEMIMKRRAEAEKAAPEEPDTQF